MLEELKKLPIYIKGSKKFISSSYTEVNKKIEVQYEKTYIQLLSYSAPIHKEVNGLL